MWNFFLSPTLTFSEINPSAPRIMGKLAHPLPQTQFFPLHVKQTLNNTPGITTNHSGLQPPSVQSNIYQLDLGFLYPTQQTVSSFLSLNSSFSGYGHHHPDAHQSSSPSYCILSSTQLSPHPSPRSQSPSNNYSATH